MKAHHDRLGRREFLTEATQTTVAVATSVGIGAAFAPWFARAGEACPSRASRISYYCNGEIHVNEIGQPEGKPVTAGHWDFKPSWSKTGDMLVCFRRLQDDPDVIKWKTARPGACRPARTRTTAIRTAKRPPAEERRRPHDGEEHDGSA